MDKALEYHCMNGVPGKVSVVPTKPCMSAEDLSYAYTPGVAKPVLEIEKDIAFPYSHLEVVMYTAHTGQYYHYWAFLPRLKTDDTT